MYWMCIIADLGVTFRGETHITHALEVNSDWTTLCGGTVNWQEETGKWMIEKLCDCRCQIRRVEFKLCHPWSNILLIFVSLQISTFSPHQSILPAQLNTENPKSLLNAQHTAIQLAYNRTIVCIPTVKFRGYKYYIEM